ncbi:uncharacterized protein MONOS_12833 [Monocercomonoides exilis]|uniref:uncharacterized protein n=1 Tax=Monocercomonoides exilis TaxID=2049356 RepID=UPI003559790F|nr:hypothetical protein MONOS_12833 [Monocercomonoides exilis]|eukprot:MONOS_12833.1-p1 / transcript=MONOS_12833.1 / gene=MONOS_12833 / organism=Monocercomonoides_exilis_PA203 / gene_product=unspecified product / transcript_product=unspecified product / location=Mono_scaffold00740:15758-16304(-) / protein_length=166 / sequence_SO=supercontig / SO=protein_coding / is_pseudo=false
MAQLSLTITLLSGKHQNEEETINVGEKKISVVGRGKAVTYLLANWRWGHVGIDHNATRSSSPSVFVVSLGSGTLSLEDVVIDSSTSGGSGISSSVFEVTLSQLKMVDVEIKNMKISQPLFAELSSAGSPSGESVLGNMTIRNVNRTGGDGSVVAKSVRGGKTFVV